MLHCVKTGATAYLRPYGEILHGDMFRQDEIYIYRVTFRKCLSDLETIPYERCHFIIDDFLRWFDMHGTSPKNPSTLILPTHKAKDYGYDGIDWIFK